MTVYQNDTKDILRSRGVKVTQQRVVVFNVMRELGHASASMICRRCEGATVATIYNVLDCLEKAGLLQRRFTPDNKMFFDITTTPHCHIYDEETCEYRDFKDDALMKMIQAQVAQDMNGFDVSNIEIQIVGHKYHGEK